MVALIASIKPTSNFAPKHSVLSTVPVYNSTAMANAGTHHKCARPQIQFARKETTSRYFATRKPVFRIFAKLNSALMMKIATHGLC